MSRAAASARLAAGWAGAAALTIAASLALSAVGVPSPTILAALVVGIVLALRIPGRVLVRAPLARGAQALVGVMLGTSLTGPAIVSLADQWAAVVATTVAVLVLSLLLGVLVQRATSIGPATATLGVIPGGAIGIVAMAHELGGDDRIVALNQYLRVLLILVLTPLLVGTGVLGAAGGIGVGQPHGDAAGLGASAVAIAVAALGWLGARPLRIPAPSLLGPMLLACACTILLPGVDIAVPTLLRDTAFALIGLDVGLRFTPQALRVAWQTLPAFAAAVVALLAGCFGLAWLLVAMTPMTLLDAYLATTPGGLTIVAATAYGAGADTGLIVAVQSVRLVVMLLLAPAAVRLTLRALEPDRRRSRA